jgi:hypothetical protein
MYPLAPVRRMSDFSGIAAGFAANVLATVVPDLFISDLLSRPSLSRASAMSPAQSAALFNYLFFMLFLIRSRVARYSLLSGSEANAFSMEAIASACFSTPIAINA